MGNHFATFAILRDRDRLHELREARYPAAGSLMQIMMNIPGPCKKLGFTYELFEICMDALQEVLASAACAVLSYERIDLMIGPVAYMQVFSDASALKQLCLLFEQEHPLSAYWDIDIYSSSGIAVGRNEVGALSRTCYLCSQSAKVCGSLRHHSLDELIGRIVTDLTAYKQAQMCMLTAKKVGT